MKNGYGWTTYRLECLSPTASAGRATPFFQAPSGFGFSFLPFRCSAPSSRDLEYRILSVPPEASDDVRIRKSVLARSLEACYEQL